MVHYMLYQMCALTTEQLLTRVQCSRAELMKGLRDLNAVEIKGVDLEPCRLCMCGSTKAHPPLFLRSAVTLRMIDLV